MEDRKIKKNKGRKVEKDFIATLNSGAFYQKGDAISDKECIEIKYTEKKAFRLSTDLLDKIWNEAFNQNRFPLFGIIINRLNEKWLLKINIIKEIK